MATFATNQVRQLYVAKAFKDSKAGVSATGDIYVEGIENGLDKELLFTYKGADTVLTSDRIPVKNISYVKAVSAQDMVVPLKSVKVALDSNVNSGNPIAGQDYVLRIILRQFYGMGEEDQYFKDAAVHVVGSTAAAVFYQKMCEALNLAFSREVGASKTSNPYLEFSYDANGVTIKEKIQDWALGTLSQERVLFEVQPTTVLHNGEDLVWGTVTDQTPAKADAVAGTTGIGNGKKIADLEYFCMGERGDQYRYIGWPNNIPTTYLVDPAQEYNVLEIHYAFTDTGVNSYRSEKDLTIVSESDAVIDSIVAALNNAIPASIEDLSGESSSD